MIDYSKTLDEIRKNLCIECVGSLDAPELIGAADAAVRVKVPSVSVAPEYVHMMWSWLEKTDIDIYAKIEDKAISAGRNANMAAEKINSAFKNGADGIQICARKGDVHAMVSALFPVVGDLFFGKKLFIGLNIAEADYFDWEEIFYQLNKVSANGILLESNSPRAKSKETDDVVGRVYGLLDSLPKEFSGQLQFSGFDINGIEAAWRLCQKMRPNNLGQLRFFVKPDGNLLND